ncbi:MBL fold metallo-hydrolase RNA specificity domain-containing protein [Gordonia neofelifaecis]|uniref:Beta-lactamase domain-containing protein n=1 Tax=Gordonia neofelifaecis NRRL B-59395 TaxID=644548 RepID=F1YJ51_9ACTN|nr:MBL fold metallo-hydrolase [Gordonia neofelifaecis]EGD55266.1 beta-lactamase domain-containing protein [Gordonia neofelifaecis NRRL B-59395]
MSTLSFTSLGAAGTVTGSKHLLERDGRMILIDCGLFQGIKNLREANWRPLPVDAEALDAVIVTHAHLDHTGYLPRLVREGFRGPIYSTPATRDVADIILRDSAHLQEREAALANKHRSSRHSPARPLYDVNDVEQTMAQFHTRATGKSFSPAREVRALFRGAGHILGAATVEVEWGGVTVAFSGDLGRYDDPLMFDPEPIPAADYLVCESTYGDRLRDDSDPADELLRVITETAGRGGTVVIPAFAVGRTQMILYYLWTLRRDGRLPEIPVYVDSPMAINAGELMRTHPAAHRLDSSQTHDMFAIAEYVRDPERSKQISADRSPKVILSASGMATGGRVLHHLAAFAGGAQHTIVLVGYQAVGTRGRSLADGARYLKLYGEWIPVRARVEDLHMLSAHADADELVRWMRGFDTAPRRTFLVHGEPNAIESMRHRLDHDLGWRTGVPNQNQTFDLR